MGGAAAVAGAGAAGGGRAARALRLLLLAVLTLAALEYLFGSILEASPIRTYLYANPYNSTPSADSKDHKLISSWPKRVQSSTVTGVQEAYLVRNSTSLNASEAASSHDNVTSLTANTTSHNATSPSRETSQNVSNYESSTPMLITKIMDGLRYLVTTESEIKKNATELPLCPEMPPDLGPIEANKTEIELEVVERRFPEVRRGGRYRPAACAPRHRVALIVPYRDRQQHLAIFLNHMHPFLMKQQIDYGIFIIEQQGSSDFNRAKLMNVGFAESQRARRGGWQCFVFHDIDLLPLDGRNLYTCPRQPRHMSASVDKLNYRLPYDDIFGGVSAMTLEQFQKVNGFSNKYWGWGGEDDDMFYRLQKMNYHIARYKMSIARYAMLKHKKSSPNPKRYQLLSQTGKMFLKDGLSTLEYELVKVTEHHLYTHVLANIDERS